MVIYARHFHDIDSDLDMMHEYVIEITLNLKTSHKALYERITRKIQDMSEYDAQEYVNDHYANDIFLSELFPALNTSWTFVAIMSFIEHQMVQLCKALQEEDKSALGVEDLKDNGLWRCDRFLKKMYNIQIARFSEWQTITTLQEIRNIIVHRLGHLDEQGNGRDDRIYNYLKDRTDAKVDQFRGMVFTHDFCLEAIEIARKFLKQAVASIPRRFFESDRPERPM